MKHTAIPRERPLANWLMRYKRAYRRVEQLEKNLPGNLSYQDFATPR